MKKLSLVLTLMFFVIGLSMAQRTITGTVTDGTDPLIGATVLAKGTTVGTVTDFDGKYSLEVPKGATMLVFSYTGFDPKEVELGAASVIDVILAEGVELSEVVVTGLGIKKEKKALGYAVTTLGASDVELKPEADVGRILRGKIPGVDITATSGLAGSGTNIIIRGYSSISGNNQPLFVVDGVPFNSATDSDRGFASGSATASSRFLDLDPNNVAEISVLKGLSATVLYGEAGRNGVVLVTTKTGSGGDVNKKMEITIDQSLHINEIASLPDDQDKYGNGWQNFASAAFSNWGAPFDQPNKNGLTNGQIPHPYSRSVLNDVLPQYKGAMYDYKAYDNLQGFFTKGTVSNTSVSISSQAAPGVNIRASYSYLSDKGFVETSKLNKHNFSLGANTQLSNGLKIGGTFNFITSDRDAPPTGVSTSSNPTGASLFSNVFYTPRSIDLNGLEWENPVDHSSIYYRGNNGIQHPTWTLHNIVDNEKINRFFSTINTSYAFTDHISMGYRLGLDQYTQRQRYTINKGGRQIPDGLMNTSERLNSIYDHNLSLAFDYDLTDDWNFSGIVGANLKNEIQDRTYTTSTQQFVYGLFTHNNFISHQNYSYLIQENTLGAYLSATVGFKNYLYINIAGRNDWTSTLEKENRSIFYPSASVSFVATDAIASLQNSTIINYLKLRAGYGTSAGYPDPYRTRNVLNTTTNSFVTGGGTILNTNSVSDRYGNKNLAPETITELEFGLEAKFLKNRIGLDFSAYNKQSSDLIIELPLDPSTGYSITTLNSASLENKGVEIGLNFIPVQTKNFQWNISGNFTKNSSKVISLADGIDQIVIDGYSNLGNFAIPGQPYGVIQGAQVLRDDNGTPIISSAGIYQAAPDIGILGDPNRDYTINASTGVSFKGLTFAALFSYVKGGDIYATTPSTLYSRGIIQETDFDRFVPVIVPGVKADGTPNDVQVTANQHFWRDGGVFIDENRVFDGTTIRLREVSLSYGLPKTFLDKTPFGAVSLTLSGQNLWFQAVNIPAGANFDTEVLSLGVGNGQGFEYMNVPTAKKYGASLRVTF